MKSKLLQYGRLVKFSHSIFALPFALSMLVIIGESRHVSIWELVYIIGAVVAARTAAMSFNRLVDRKFDAANPRTASRELPSGVVGEAEAIFLVVAASFLFMTFSLFLGFHCLLMSPVVLGILLGYSFAKRYTRYSHMILGLALACAPGGVWFALKGWFAWEPIPFMLAVLFWVAGFDILYACQDMEFDRKVGLNSIPARYGLEASLNLSRFLHLGCIISLLIAGVMLDRGSVYFLGVVVFTLIIASQHFRVSAENISKIDVAFFTRNGSASVLFFLFTLVDVLRRVGG